MESRQMLRSLKTVASVGVRVVTDRRYREFYQQRRITELPAREAAASRLAGRLPRSPPSAAAFREPLEKLTRDGYVYLAGLVTRSQIDDMLAYFADLPCRDPYRPHLGTFKAPEEVPAQTHVSHYSNEQIVEAPHILSIANDPRLLSIVEGHLGAKPTLAAMRVWWSTPTKTGEPEHAEKFHRDVDDLRFIKLFVFLTDVDDASGPHIFASGSHRKNVLTKIRRYSDDEVESAVGPESVVRFTGPAGTCFLENTYGLHRGLPPVSRPRLVFQPLYALRPIIFGPKNPLRARTPEEAAALDPYINRVFLRS